MQEEFCRWWKSFSFLVGNALKTFELPCLMRYVYIDETGDLGKKGSRYFVITAVWVDKPERFDRLIKNIRRYKFRKELKNAQEIKARLSSKKLIEHILKKFSGIENAYAKSIILDKKNIHKDDKKEFLYAFACGHLADISIGEKNLLIRIDRSKRKQKLIAEFNAYLNNRFNDVKWNRKIKLVHSWSHEWRGLQIADVVSWAVFQAVEFESDYYTRMLGNKLRIEYVK